MPEEYEILSLYFDIFLLDPVALVGRVRAINLFVMMMVFVFELFIVMQPSIMLMGEST